MTNFPKNFKLSNITIGPTTEVVDELLALTWAVDLYREKYFGVSSSYSTIARPDCDDWLEKLAVSMGRSPAQFYNPISQKIEFNWVDHYCRRYTKDKHVVHPAVYQQLKKLSYNRLKSLENDKVIHPEPLSVKRYRLKPPAVTFDALQIDVRHNSLESIKRFLGDNLIHILIDNKNILVEYNPCLLDTTARVSIAKNTDFIVRKSPLEFETLSNLDFSNTYEVLY